MLVQSLVIDPIWKTESVVASTPVAVLSTPAACVDDLTVGEHAHRRGRVRRTARSGRVGASAIHSDTSSRFVMPGS